MPTGYTAGIVDGKINTFEEFAKKCMRAFGATIHMRDDSLEEEYQPRVPSSYYKEQLDNVKRQIEELESTSDEDLVKNHKAYLIERKDSILKTIEERGELLKRIDSILTQTKEYNPPTSEHQGIKDFMIQQLTETISWDCKVDYYLEELDGIMNEYSKVDAIELRIEKRMQLQKDLDYHKKQFEEEIERCNASNLWVGQFMQSLEGAEKTKEELEA